MAEEPIAPVAAPPSKGGSKLLPVILIMNTLLLAGVLVFIIKKPSSAPAASAAAGAAKEGAAAAPKEGEAKEGEVKEGEVKEGDKTPPAKRGPGDPPGPILKLDNFIIQIRAPEGERYVRVAFDLELGAETDKEFVTARMSRIRDAIISFFSDQTLEELRGSEGMERVKAGISKRLDAIVPGKRIKAMFVTDFIVQ